MCGKGSLLGDEQEVNVDIVFPLLELSLLAALLLRKNYGFPPRGILVLGGLNISDLLPGTGQSQKL